VNVLKRFSGAKAIVGVELRDDALNVAVKNTRSDKISAATVLPIDGENDTAKTSLSEWVENNKLTKQSCNVVLSAKDYQLLMIEKPQVSDEELRDAVKWKLKDLVTSPLESLAVDAFEIPSTTGQQSKAMMYAVVTDLEKVKSIIDLVHSAKLKLNAIDIDAFALRNLMLSKDSSRGLAILRLSSGAGELGIYRDGYLYLSRRFQLDYGGGLLDDIPAEALGLELQRSFDYLERQMRQIPPAVLYICGEGVGSEKIDDNLRQHVSLPVEYLHPCHFIELESDEAIDEGIAQVCVAALGCVMREEGV
jgi:MSHA biogenesis protein MshI